jgi:hypothetical protein
LQGVFFSRGASPQFGQLDAIQLLASIRCAVHECRLRAYSVEKLRHWKIVTNNWNIILQSGLLATAVCRRFIFQDNILLLRVFSAKH